jgi:hypothetical protein
MPARSQSPQFTNPKVGSDGSFQAKLITTPGQSYTIEASTKLTNWKSRFCFTNVGSEVVFFDPPTSAGCAYYRAVQGTKVVSQLAFRFSAFGGAWAQSWGAFPVRVDDYEVLFTSQNDSDYPSADQVLFTGPSESGLLNSPAAALARSQYSASLAGEPGAGIWTVKYKGAILNFEMTDPRADSRMVIPFPTVTQQSGSFLVSWTYRDASTGVDLGGPPVFLTQITVSLGDYTSGALSRETTNCVLQVDGVLHDGTSLVMTYSDTFNNEYSVIFAQTKP